MLLDGIVAAIMSAGAVPPPGAVPPSPPPSAASSAPALGGDDAQTLITAVDAAQRMTVDVFVNGSGPYNFAVDTGADRTAVARSLSDRLALPKGKAATMHSMGGTGQIGTAMISTLQVGTNEVRDVRAPVLADQHIGVSGLLGVDSLADQRIEMDFIAGRMKIYPSRASRQHSEPGTITVTARRKYGQLILVDADIDGEKVNVILDSGAQISIGNSVLRRRLTREGKQGGAVQPITLVDVAGRTMQAEMAVLPRIRIGGLHVEGLSIAWADAYPFKLFGMSRKPAMLLGMDLLRSFERVSVDFGNRKVRFLIRESGQRGLASRDEQHEEKHPVKDVAG